MPAGSREGAPGRSRSGRAARFWPAVFAVLVLAGCGGATAPCPTPTTELDRLRAESQKVEGDLDQATDANHELKAKRDEASRRIEAARAELDSLGQGGAP